MIWGLSSMAGDSFAWGSKYSQEGKDSAAVAFSLIIGFSCVLGGWLQLSIERS